MRHAALLRAAACYALAVAAVWGPFTFGSGMPHETLFPYGSETQTLLRGFVYGPDPLRIGASFFYQVGYLLGEAGGVGGSFAPYQIVFALLWWLQGLLLFLILRRVAPDQPLFCLAAGGLVILHGSDTTINWIGVMTQWGALVWALAAAYALLRAQQAESQRARHWTGAAAVGLLVASLFTYESAIVLFFALPLLFALADRERRLLRSTLVAWYAVIAVYLLLAARRYLWIRPATSYQLQLLRSEASPGVLLHDLWFQLRASLEFWRWGAHLPEDVGPLFALVAQAVCVIAAGLALELWLRRNQSEPLPGRAAALRWLAVGGGLALLSFPAFLLLRDAGTSLWRTQLLSRVGAGIALVAAAAALCSALPRRRARELVFVLGVCGIAAYGASAALRAGAWERALWERHRLVMVDLLEELPDLASPTVVVLTGVPAAADPFLGHTMWFDAALRLAYPGRQISGFYLRDDGLPAPGGEALGEIDPRIAIVVRLAPDGVRLLDAPPQDGPLRQAAWQEYAPAERILPGPVSARVQRRYGASP